MLMLLLLPPMITTIIITAPPFSALSLAVIYDHRHLTCDNIFYVYSMRETWVQSLDQKAFLEKELATHSSTLAWEVPWTEEPGGLQSMGSQRVRHDLAMVRQILSPPPSPVFY